MVEEIVTDDAPAAIGPYAQAVKAGNFLFLSGQLPIDPNDQQLVHREVRTQTRQVLANINSILKSQQLEITNLVKTTIFINDMNHFQEINEEYSQFMQEHRPARSAVEVSRLPKDVLVEIEAIAVFED
ncbi:endoribonuclease L-PSP [Geomicrobium sp. JCM 19037]|uniref:RidA family protein n=1 Tax=Geomicrobium sp. JCM 19037 TaxID=1460634 RepID=UPI00045F3107|nr:RidA family protein [Geomicrobium sp. JCM 19037]GAK04921.1 endoribonuclease L-PSP [Geomicrobium sp. JCM 19037]